MREVSQVRSSVGREEGGIHVDAGAHAGDVAEGVEDVADGACAAGGCCRRRWIFHVVEEEGIGVATSRTSVKSRRYKIEAADAHDGLAPLAMAAESGRRSAEGRDEIAGSRPIRVEGLGRP